MSRAPFIFGAGAGQAAPAFPSPHQQNGNHNNTPPSFSHSTSAPPPPPSPSQHAAFQQNGQLPGIDMSALAGVSPDQVALIAHLLQTGALPPPPPPPPPVPPAQQQASASVASANPRQSQPENKQEEGSDMDREEGEVEDGEAGNTPPQSTPQGFSRAPPTGPRNTATSRRSSQYDSRQNHRDSSPQSRRVSNLNARSISGKSAARSLPEPSREHQAKQLVLTMHKAGFSYEDLVQTAGVDPRPLQRMFKQLGLPLSSGPHPTNGGQSASGASLDRDPSRPLHASTAEVSQKPSPVAKAPAPGKLDRSAYLAKLQAAKAGKAGPMSAQSASASEVQEQPVAESSTSAKLQPTTAASVTVSTASSTSKAVKTELARQRLEAFKAEQAAKQQNKSLLANTQPSSSPVHASVTAAPTGVASPAAVSQNGLGVGLDNVSTVAGDETSSLAMQYTNQPPQTFQNHVSSVPATPGSAFGGLPGLFMNAAPQQASPPSTATPTRTLSQYLNQSDASTQQDNLARKRLAEVESDRMAPQAKRPFGQSRSASEDESFIIENSDDEEDGLPMDVGATIETIRTSLQSRSQSSVPEASTAQAKTLEQKVKAIEDLNRKIAEREARAKAQANLQAHTTTASDAVNGTTSSGIPGISSSMLPNATVEEQAITQDGPSTPQEKPLKKQKEELRQRIAELENAHKVSGLNAGESGAKSTPTSNAQAFESSANAQSSIEAIKKSTQMDEVTDTPVVEDDDATSESDFDFYGNEEAFEIETLAKASRQDDLQAGATTAEANADADEESPSTTHTHSRESTDNVDMVEDDAFQEPGPLDTEMSMHDHSGPAPETADVNDVADVVDAQTQGSEADVEMQSDESDSDDSSRPDEPTDAANVDDQNIGSTDGAVSSDPNEDEPGSSSSGSEDSEDYDPESDVQFEGRLGNATASQPAMPVDGGLAPELQPALQQAPAETTDQVRSTSDRLHGN